MTEEKYQYETGSALHIELYYNAERLASGTGFCVEGGHGGVLLTARHNLTGRHQVSGQALSRHGGVPNLAVVWHHTASGLGWVAVGHHLYNEDGSPAWREHPTLGSRADLAAIDFSLLPQMQMMPLHLQREVGLMNYITAEVYVVGFPLGYDVELNSPVAIWTRGSIATEPGLSVDGLPLTLIDARTRSGQSGAPVFRQESGVTTLSDGRSHVLVDGPIRQLFGLYTGRLHAEADIGRVWRTSALQELTDDGVYPSEPTGERAAALPPVLNPDRREGLGARQVE